MKSLNDPACLKIQRKGSESSVAIGKPHSGYKAIDASATLDFLIANADDPQLGKYLQLAVAKRPAEELFDIVSDPGCLKNLTHLPEHAATREELSKRLEEHLRQTGDARVIDGGEIWETYPRYSAIRSFPKPEDAGH